MKTLCSLVFAFAVAGQAQEPAVFASYYAKADHTLDPDPNSTFWKDVKGVPLDKSITGEVEPALASEARSRWTGKYLYFLFYGPYQVQHLKPDPDTVHETWKLWNWDDFELYLGTNFENINLYGEYQISPQSEFLDQAIDATKERPGWGDEHLWDSGMSVKSRIDGDKKIWYGEMRIPIAAIEKRTPKAGLEMRVNVYRLQAVVPITDPPPGQTPPQVTGRGTGQAAGRSGGQPGGSRRIHFLAWQPTGEWNPHRPLKFGILRFVE